MVARVRTQSGVWPGGSTTNIRSGAVTVQGNRNAFVYTCSDANPGPGGLVIDKTDYEVMRINGERNGIRFNAYLAENAPLPNLLVPPSASASDTAKLLARSNPSRPVVDLPVFLAELRDLPHILKFLRDKGLRWLAGANLSYQFGIRPLVNDLYAMTNIALSVERRKKELRRLIGTGGLRAKVRLGSNTETTHSAPTTISSVAGTIRGTWVTSKSYNRWAVTTWEPIQGYSQTLDEAWIENHTWRVVLGVNPSLSQIWELMPWSWAIDYFTNIGDVLASTRNVVMARPGLKWVMCENRSSTTGIPTGEVPSTHSGFQRARRVVKQRVVAPGLIIEASLPFLTASQTSIIASLFVLRDPTLRRIAR